MSGDEKGLNLRKGEPATEAEKEMFDKAQAFCEACEKHGYAAFAITGTGGPDGISAARGQVGVVVALLVVALEIMKGMLENK